MLISFCFRFQYNDTWKQDDSWDFEDWNNQSYWTPLIVNASTNNYPFGYAGVGGVGSESGSKNPVRKLF